MRLDQLAAAKRKRLDEIDMKLLELKEARIDYESLINAGAATRAAEKSMHDSTLALKEKELELGIEKERILSSERKANSNPFSSFLNLILGD